MNFKHDDVLSFPDGSRSHIPIVPTTAIGVDIHCCGEFFPLSSYYQADSVGDFPSEKICDLRFSQTVPCRDAEHVVICQTLSQTSLDTKPAKV